MRDHPLSIRYSIKQFCLPGLHVFELKDGSNVATSVTIVRGRPHRHQPVVKHVLDALVNKLVSPADQLEAVKMHELEEEIMQ